MSDIAIKVEDLSKLYRIGKREPYRTLRDSIMSVITAPFSVMRKARSNEVTEMSLLSPANSLLSSNNGYLWAVKDISFEVRQGEVIGIIGRNGAGKSTLLKILSRITEPTGGYADIHGRVGSLLEVGTGFHPELTGRENIFLNGAILGMKKTEIEGKFDEIVAFAEVEKFIDTPVKHYSSGMYVRLAFAVAAHLEPEILLVDEVLAVGDATFQKKCLCKMGNTAREGRTVLFVSHNMGAITRLCERSFCLDEGQIIMDGASNQVVNHYHAQYIKPCAEWNRATSEVNDNSFAFLHVILRNSENRSTSLFDGDECLYIEIRYIVRRPLSGCQIGARLSNSEGLVVFTTTDADNSGVSALPKEPGCYRTHFTIQGSLLAPGKYHLLVAAHLPYRSVYEVIEQAVVFEVSPARSLVSLDGRLGIITPLIHWETQKEPLS